MTNDPFTLAQERFAAEGMHYTLRGTREVCFILDHPRTTFYFFPKTGLWVYRGSGSKNYGLEHLIEFYHNALKRSFKFPASQGDSPSTGEAAQRPEHRASVPREPIPESFDVGPARVLSVTEKAVRLGFSDHKQWFPKSVFTQQPKPGAVVFRIAAWFIRKQQLEHLIHKGTSRGKT